MVRDVVYTRCPNLNNCTAADLEANATPGAMLIPFANRVLNGTYVFNGKVHHLTPNNATASQGFLIQGRTMHTVAFSTTEKHAELVLGYTFDGTDSGYPFVIEVNITYTLSTVLTVRVDALNRMESTAAPFMVGCHPYFHLMHGGFDSSKVVLGRQCTEWNRQWQTSSQVPNGSATLFTGLNGSDTILDPHVGCPACAVHWDDGFTSLNEQCTDVEVKIVDGPDTMVLTLGKGYRYVQVYSGNSDEGVAVEPMSSETNSWNNEDGIVVLEAGGQSSFTFHIGVEGTLD